MADNEISHCCLTQLPQVQGLVKMVLPYICKCEDLPGLCIFST